MIDEYRLENFKSFSELEMRFSRANLIVGLNSAGKSALIQPLILARQSAVTGALRDGRLALNGPLVNLGTGQDLLFEFADTERIVMAWSGSELVVGYQADESELEIDLKGVGPLEAPPFDRLIYVGNDRLGPQRLYERHRSYEQPSPIAGVGGENAPGYLGANGNTTPNGPGSKRHEGVAGTLLEQVNYWMGRVSPNVSLNVDELHQLDGIAMRYVLDGKAGVPTRPYRGANVGFGVSHVLSIVTALLAAAPGSVLIIEAPEANLHPMAQMALGDLVGQAAGDGVQVMLETHSAYVVSGLGQAVVRGRLPANEVTLHYCTRIDAESKVTHVGMNGRGGLDQIAGYDDVPQEYLDEFFKPGFPGYGLGG